MNKLTQQQLDQLTAEMNDYMEETGRKRFPPAKIDELRDLGVRRCSKCSTVKNIEEFGKDSGKRDGLNNKCKACAIARSLRYRHANRERISEYDRNLYYDPEDNRRLRQQLHQGYYRAIEAGNTAVRITPEELLAHWKSVGIDPLVCYLTGETLTPLTRSLDHIDAINNGGEHTVTNLAPCTAEANTKKSTLSADEARASLSA